MADARFLTEEERRGYQARVRELREQLKAIGRLVPPPTETEVCTLCGGSGWVERGGDPEVCPECDGRSEAPSQRRHDDHSEEPF